MPIYSIVRRADRAGFDIFVKDESGSRHTILGFETEEEAKAWATEDQRWANNFPPRGDMDW